MKFQVHVSAHSHPWHSAWCITLYIFLELTEFSGSYLPMSFEKEELQKAGYSQMSGTKQYGIQTAF